MPRTPTEDALLAMLRENTGSHFLDSGRDGDRHHQRNQSRDIENEAPSALSFQYGDIRAEHRVFHWLRERVTLDGEANEVFDGPFRDAMDPAGDANWCELRAAFPDWYARLRSLRDLEADCEECDGATGGAPCEDCGGTGKGADDSLYAVTGIYGEGEPVTVDSFDQGSLLDQTLLFTYFELRSGEGRGGCVAAYVALQIHGGCDVRGGYTRPRVFEVELDDLAIFDCQRGTIACSDLPSHGWTTDDGYRWYAEGTSGQRSPRRLEQYEHADREGGDEWQVAMLTITPSEEGRCPICGHLLRTGALRAASPQGVQWAPSVT